MISQPRSQAFSPPRRPPLIGGEKPWERGCLISLFGEKGKKPLHRSPRFRLELCTNNLTCSCARSNDAIIVPSGDAQCNTKELPQFPIFFFYIYSLFLLEKGCEAGPRRMVALSKESLVEEFPR